MGLKFGEVETCVLDVCGVASEVKRAGEVEMLCMRCDKPVVLVAETCEWEERGGKRRHAGYGPPSETCCGLVYVGFPDGSVKAFGFGGDFSQLRPA